jgi:hypothetical protein
MYFVFSFLLVLTACTGIKYEADTGYPLPTASGSLESIVYINGVVCKDMDNVVGICSKRLKNDTDLVLDIPPKDYGYNLNIVCSSNIAFEANYDVIKKQGFKVTVPSNNFYDERHFICIGEIRPNDRDFVSHKFEVRVRVLDAEYVSRNEMMTFDKGRKTYLVCGKHARYVSVYQDGEWKFYNKKPVLKFKKGELANVQVISESESGRLNYYNL